MTKTAMSASVSESPTSHWPSPKMSEIAATRAVQVVAAPMVQTMILRLVPFPMVPPRERETKPTTLLVHPGKNGG